MATGDEAPDHSSIPADMHMTMDFSGTAALAAALFPQESSTGEDAAPLEIEVGPIFAREDIVRLW